MLYPRAFVVFLLFAVDYTSGLSEDGVVPVNDVTAGPNIMSPQSCVTGKNVAGTCVKREKCDYGTTAIDFTLYRPRGYRLTCLSSEDVCCPPQFLVPQEDKVWVSQNGFDFDDDD